MGRAPGRGKGELGEFVRNRRSVKPFATGPNRFAPFDERTRERQAEQSRARADVFTDAAGHVQHRVSTGRVNFRDARGGWAPIDTDLEATGGRLRQKANDLDVQVATRADNANLVRVGLDASRSVGQSLEGAARVTAQVEGPNAFFLDVLPDTDLRLSTSTDGVKETLVLKSREAATTWTFPLTLRGLTARINDYGDVEYLSAAGEVLLISPRPFMTDAGADPLTGEARRSDLVRYELLDVKGKPTLRVVADAGWIAQEGRKFPVEVDPPLIYPDTMDTYTDSTTPGDNNSSEGTLAMGTPNDGARLARSYMDFKDVPIAPANVNVSTVKLYLFLSYVTSCSAQPFDVHTITSTWSAGGLTTYSTTNPTLGSKLGSASPSVSTADACGNSPVDPARGKWVSVTLSPSSFRNWTTSGIHGLALKAPTNTGNTWKRFTSENFPSKLPYLEITYANNARGQVDEATVADPGSLTPQFIAKGTDPDAFPRSGDLDYEFKVYTAPYNPAATPPQLPVTGSGRVAVGNWRAPAGTLTWATDYVWTVQTFDGLDVGPIDAALPLEPFTTTIPQPAVGATLAKASGERGFDPNTGNLNTTATDATVNSVGPAASVERTYNSRDPRTATAFGASWSTPFDLTVTEVKDPVSNALTGAVITHPDGHRERYARDAAGKFLPGEGFFATLTAITGGYQLVDESTTWTFTHAITGQTGVFGIVSVRDGPGRTLTYTRTGGLITKATTASGRSLTLTWTTPAGGAAAHVATVTTDPAVPADPNTAQTWTYSYSGDRLTKVCPPTSATECTAYEYQNGSPYPTAVLDSCPHTWWRLGEAAGATIAGDAIVDNQGRYPADYANVTLGATASPIANSGGKAADFNGTSSRVTLPRRPDWNVGTISFGLWFKTTTPDRVLLGWAEDPLANGTTTASYIPGLYLGTDGKLRAQLSRGSTDPTPLVTPASVADGTWHHVTLTASGGTSSVQALYLDGNLVSTQSRNAFNSKRTAVTLGAGFIGDLWPGHSRYSTTNATGYASWFKGSISDFTVHDRTLGAGEVKALWTAATTTAPALLTKVTTPAGRTASQASWDVYRGAVAGVTDANGGTWGIAAPAILGSSTGLLGAIRTAKPRAYWRLGDTAATLAAEDSGDQADYATVNNVVLGRTGPFGVGDSTATEFNGTTSHLTALPGYDIGTKSAFTISLWFKTSTAGRVLFGYSADALTTVGAANGFVPALYVGSDGKLYGQYWHGSVNPIASTKTVTDGKWHQAALTAGNGKQNLYLDGATVGERLGTIAAPGLPYITIGAGFLGGTWPAQPNPSSRPANYFHGDIAEVALYERPLAATEVTAQWTAYSTSSTTYPIKTIVITDPTGKTITDRYDPAHADRVLSHANSLGQTTANGYDTRGFARETVEDSGLTLISGKDIRGNTVSRMVCQDQAAQACSTETWDYFLSTTDPLDPRNDKQVSAEDPRPGTQETKTTYAANGEPTKVTGPPVPGAPDGQETLTTYTDAGTAAEGGGTPPPGLVASVTTPAGAITEHKYYANGDLASTTDPLELITLYSYDGLGRVLTTTVESDTFPDGVVTTQTWDANNRVLTRTDPATDDSVTGVAHTAHTTMVYDPDSLVLSTTVADLTGGDTARATSAAYDERGRQSSATDGVGRTETFGYDVYGNRTSTTAPDGTVTISAYDSERQLLTVTLKNYAGDPTKPGPLDLVTESRAYDPAGRLASVTDAMGWTVNHTYFDDGSLAEVTRTDNAGKNFVQEDNTYDEAGNLTRQVTSNGATRSDFAYDAAGRRNRTEVDPGSLARVTTLAFDLDDRVTTTTLSSGPVSHVVDDTYDVMGNQLSRAVSDGSTTKTTRWGRDQRGLMVSTTDPLGAVTSFVNDELGRQAAVVAPAVATENGIEGVGATTLTPITRIGYDTFGGAVHNLDANGNVTTTGYDLAGRATSLTSPTYTPPGATTSVTPVKLTAYDAMGRVSEEIDALARSTTHTYDQLGNVLSTSAPGNAVTRNTWTSNGELLSTTTPSGARTESTWDWMGRRVTETSVERNPTATHTTTNTYGTGGWLTRQTTAAGVVTNFGYNAAGEQTTVTDGAGNTTTQAYDLAGRLVRTTNPDGTAHAVTLDVSGNQIAAADLGAAGATLRTTTAVFDAADRQTSATDANGAVTTWTRDASGFVTAQTEPVAAGTIETSSARDAAGNMTRFTDGRGNAFRTAYNPWNQPERRVEPATPAHPDPGDRTWITNYDPGGRITRTDAPGGVSTTRSYDLRGNLTEEAGSGAEVATPTRTFDYDVDDRMVSVSAPDGSNSLTWDDRGNLTSTTGPSGAATFAYDPDGRMTSRADAAGTSTYLWDNVGRLAAMTDAATANTGTRSYDANSRLRTITHGGGVTRAWAWDELGRLTSDAVTAPGGASLARFDYGYDGNDNLTSKTSAGVAGAGIHTYAYDQANRLTRWTQGATTTDYGYDASGNRTTAGSASTAFDARNRIITQTDAQGVTSYTWAARGTLAATTGAVTRSAAFDAFDQLRTDTATAAGAAGPQTYNYDALARQLSASPSGGGTGPSTTYTYSGIGHDVAADTRGTHALDPDGAPVAGKDPGGAATLTMTDRHQDVVATYTPTASALSASTAYDPNGRVTATAGTLPGTLGFQSDPTDPATGRVDMWHRRYDPTTSTFDSRDPTELNPNPLSAAVNRYLYAGANPLRYSDPDGYRYCDPMYPCRDQPSPNGGRDEWDRYYDRKQKEEQAEREAAARQYRAAVSLSHQVAQYRMALFEEALDAVVNGARIDQATSASLQPARGITPTQKDELKKSLGAGIYPVLRMASLCASEYKGRLCVERHRGEPATQYTEFTPCRKNASSCLFTFGAAVLEGLLVRVGLSGIKAVRMISGTHIAKVIGNNARALRFVTTNRIAALPGSQFRPRVSCFLPGSFAPGTPVLLPDGTTVAIERIQAGDLVTTTDPTTSRTTAGTVTAVHSTAHDNDLLDLEVAYSDGTTGTIRTTRDHELWDLDAHTWTAARKLQPGHKLRTDTGAEAALTNVRPHPGAGQMWDLTVEPSHTYYVLPTGADGSAGTTVLVHNCGDWARISGILREAKRGKGNFGLGVVSGPEADALGRAWVGSGHKVASDGKTLVSKDKLRQYRPPSWKPDQRKIQANLQGRARPEKEWQSNGHLDIR